MRLIIRSDTNHNSVFANVLAVILGLFPYGILLLGATVTVSPMR